MDCRQLCRIKYAAAVAMGGAADLCYFQSSQRQSRIIVVAFGFCLILFKLKKCRSSPCRCQFKATYFYWAVFSGAAILGRFLAIIISQFIIKSAV